MRTTRLRPVPGIDGLSLYLTDDIRATWRATQVATSDPDAALPYWSVAWGGGLALASYLRDRPDVVAGRRVLDVASGSGIVAIAAAQAGAADVLAADIDPFAVEAIELSAKANGVRIAVVGRDVLDEEPPDVDVVLAGDCWYEPVLARRALAWLRRARSAGIEVLTGDPGRADLPSAALQPIASYGVRTTSDLEDLELRQASVYRLDEPDASRLTSASNTASRTPDGPVTAPDRDAGGDRTPVVPLTRRR